MKLFRKIDTTTGNFLEDVLFESEPPSSDGSYISTPVPQGFYWPKWNGESWEEGATQEYIDSLKPEPQELPLEEKNRADIDYLSVMTGVEL